MATTWLGTTGVRLPRLFMGTMTFGRECDAAASLELYRQARDAGLFALDTADVYAGGQSEELLGRFMRGHRDEVFVATKAYFPTGPGPNDRGLSRLHVTQAIESSLRRLGTDRIDLFYLHRFDPHTDLQDTLTTLQHAIAAGKILYYGLSNFAAWQMAHCHTLARARNMPGPAAVQPMYNLLKRQAESEIIPCASSLGISVIPYSPLAGGLLTGKYLEARSNDKVQGRFDTDKMYQTRYSDPRCQATVHALHHLATTHGTTAASLAWQWLLHNKQRPCVPIVGASRPEHLRTAIEAMSASPTDALLAQIDGVSDPAPPATDRSEETSAHTYGTR